MDLSQIRYLYTYTNYEYICKTSFDMNIPKMSSILSFYFHVKPCIDFVVPLCEFSSEFAVSIIEALNCA